MGRRKGQKPAGSQHYNHIPQVVIKPKTKKQSLLLKSMRQNDITFAIGAAGGGKTHCAISYALKLLLEGSVERIILVRPAIEAGEKLGFLPGKIQDKMEPYLQPVFDIVRKHLGPNAVKQLLGDGKLEISPLAYMRGRTLDGAFVIFDEAQNATDEQMEMFLTRIGDGAKFVICGDHTQNDLRPGSSIGLINGAFLMKDAPRVGLVVFEEQDAMRHELIPYILKQYREFKDAAKKSNQSGVETISVRDLRDPEQGREVPDQFDPGTGGVDSELPERQEGTD